MSGILNFNGLDINKNSSLKFSFLSSFPGRYNFHFPVGSTEAWIVYATLSSFGTVEEFAKYVLALPYLKYDHYDYESIKSSGDYKLKSQNAEEILSMAKGVFDTYCDFTESYFMRIQLKLDPSSIQDGFTLETVNSEQIIFFKESRYYVGIVGE